MRKIPSGSHLVESESRSDVLTNALKASQRAAIIRRRLRSNRVARYYMSQRAARKARYVSRRSSRGVNRVLSGIPRRLREMEGEKNELWDSMDGDALETEESEMLGSDREIRAGEESNHELFGEIASPIRQVRFDGDGSAELTDADYLDFGLEEKGDVEAQKPTREHELDRKWPSPTEHGTSEEAPAGPSQYRPFS